MHKLRIGVYGGGGDLARLYRDGDGFVAGEASAAFPARDTFYMMMVSLHEYALACDGDLVKDSIDDDLYRRSAESHIFHHSFHWSDAAKQRGSGSGRIVITHPNHADRPMVFTVTMGDATVGEAHFAEQAAASPEAQRAFVDQMMTQEISHQFFGHVLPAHGWDEAFRDE